jgi:hypothetical protein
MELFMELKIPSSQGTSSCVHVVVRISSELLCIKILQEATLFCYKGKKGKRANSKLFTATNQRRSLKKTKRKKRMDAHEVYTRRRTDMEILSETATLWRRDWARSIDQPWITNGPNYYHHHQAPTATTTSPPWNLNRRYLPSTGRPEIYAAPSRSTACSRIWHSLIDVCIIWFVCRSWILDRGDNHTSLCLATRFVTQDSDRSISISFHMLTNTLIPWLMLSRFDSPEPKTHRKHRRGIDGFDGHIAGLTQQWYLEEHF